MVLARVRTISRGKGVFYALFIAIKYICWDNNVILNYVLCRYFQAHKSSRTFRFQGRHYGYFCHRYNNTWRNERAVEVPIIWQMVEGNREGRVLEVGNVLSHYFPVSHDVLDKYEANEGVINQDVADFQTSKKYDLIVSISTLEHVGWDEFPQSPRKILRAIDNLKSILTPGGKIAVTIPLGYNPVLDGLLINGKVPFTRRFFMKRVSRDNQWEEADWTEVVDSKYSFHISSNALLIGIIEGQGLLTASYKEATS